MSRSRRSRLLLAAPAVLLVPLLGAVPANAAPAAGHGAPAVTSLSSTSGPTSGGQRITVHGSRLRGTRAVTVGSRSATHVHVESGSRLTATVPAQKAGSYPVRVRTAGGTSAVTKAARYTYVARPVVTQVQLIHGSGLGGSRVEVHGRNLGGAVSVRFGAARATRAAVTGSTATVTVPTHAPGRLHVQVSTPGGTSPTGADDIYQMPAPNTQRWDEQTYLEPEQNDLADISCPTARTCFVTDHYNSVWRVDDGVWSDPTHLPASTYPALPWQISCPTTDFCAIAGRIHAYLYDDGAWSLGPSLDSQSVSCPSAGHCVFLAQDSYTVLDDGTWTTAADPEDYLTQVSCYDDTHCIAVGNGARGVAYLWDGSTWTRMESMQGPHGLLGLSCASATLCAAYDSENGVSTWDGSTWTGVQTLDASDAVGRQAISCRGDGCVFDDSHSLYTFRDGAWTQSSASSKDYDLVGCEHSATSCLGQDVRGDIVSFDGSTWHATSEKLGRVSQVSSLDCPTASFCGMSDESGNVYTYDGRTWTAPQNIADTAVQQSAVSCPTSTFCLAVFGNGRAATYDGSGWSDAAPSTLVDTVLSCASPTFCLAGGAHGSEVFDGHGWSAVAGSAEKIISVSCASSSFCVAVTPDELETFDGTRWQSSVADSDLVYADPHSISCPSTSFCLAVDDKGRQLEYEDGSWSDPVATLIAYPLALSCFSDTFCQTFGNGSSQTYDGSIWTAVYQAGAFQDSMDVDGLSCYAQENCIAASGDQIFSSKQA